MTRKFQASDLLLKRQMEVVMKKKQQKSKVTRTTGGAEMKKRPARKVLRDGHKTYEAYADEYWDQAP